MATLKAIADRTGFSVSVVSRALNPAPDVHAFVSDRTRRAIHQAAEELGHRPNRAAEFLKRGRTPEIGLFMPRYADRLGAELIFGISEAAQEHGFPLSIHVGVTAASYRRFIESHSDMMHSGILTYPYFTVEGEITALLDQYRREGGNLVLLNPLGECGDLPAVRIDDEQGGALVANRLLERGCRRFMVHDYFVRRAEGFISALRRRGFDAQVTDAGHGDNQLEAALTQDAPGPLGIFCTRDRLAVRTLGLLQERGLQPGRDVMVIGYDNLELSGDVRPALTTIDQPFAQLGRAAVGMLLRLIYGKPVKDQTIAPSLVARQSG